MVLLSRWQGGGDSSAAGKNQELVLAQLVDLVGQDPAAQLAPAAHEIEAGGVQAVAQLVLRVVTVRLAPVAPRPPVVLVALEDVDDHLDGAAGLELARS